MRVSGYGDTKWGAGRALGLLSLLFVVGLVVAVAARPAYAADWTIEYLETSVVSKGIGRASSTITYPANIIGHSYLSEAYVKNLPANNNYYNKQTTDHCYPKSGSSGSFSSATSSLDLNSSVHQTANTSFSSPLCNVSGTYYVIYRDATASSSILYVSAYYYNATTNQFAGALIYENATGTKEIDYNTAYNTRFTNIDLGTATNTVEFDVAYFVDSNEATTTQSDKNPTQIRVRYSLSPGTSVGAYGFPMNVSSPSWGNGTTSVTLPFTANSTYDVNIQFGNAGTAITGIVPFPLANVYFQVHTDANGGIASTTEIEFYDAIEEQSLPYQDCSITSPTGCFINAGIYMFYPSYESINKLRNVQTTMMTKIPFIYVAQTPDLWESLWNASGTQALTVSASTTIGEITFISAGQLEAIPLTDTIRTIVGFLLWFMLALTIYYRVRTVFNHQGAV